MENQKKISDTLKGKKQKLKTQNKRAWPCFNRKKNRKN